MWLLISVWATTGFFVLFKLFSRWQVRIFPAIVVNYFTCFFIGFIMILNREGGNEVNWTLIITPLHAAIGMLFIGVFNATGMSTKFAGAGATSVAAKMSVVIPVLAASFVLNEKLNVFQWGGVAMALGSVYLVSSGKPTNEKQIEGWKNVILLMLVFIGSGGVDTALQMIKLSSGGKAMSDIERSTAIFGFAAIWGLLFYFFKIKYWGKIMLKEVGSGILLGGINFLSLVALFAGLASFPGESAWFFVFNNVGVVICSALLGWWLFKEHLSRKQYIGLGLSLVAMVLLNMAS